VKRERKLSYENISERDYCLFFNEVSVMFTQAFKMRPVMTLEHARIEVLTGEMKPAPATTLGCLKGRCRRHLRFLLDGKRKQ
jgi:hypothetical protein